MPPTFGIVDLFAGPGGLGEGFASHVNGGHSPFHIGISIEKESSAHRTLRLRAFLRDHRNRHGGLPQEYVDFHAGASLEPDWESIDPAGWHRASNEARCLALGTNEATDAIDEVTKKLHRNFDDTILIGGPPCQAYSLVGRARTKGNLNYVPEEDERHYLFREYIRVLDRLRPAAFIMENVKGMLSSTVESRLVFELLMEDLSSLGRHGKSLYELRAIRIEDGVAKLETALRSSDFIVKAEAFGVPQRRHRVIIVGVRSDLASGIAAANIAVPRVAQTVEDAIGALPALRSGLSHGDDAATWQSTVMTAARSLAEHYGGAHELGLAFADVASRLSAAPLTERSARTLPLDYCRSNDELARWIERPELRALAQHDTRGHMMSDLSRYLFSATFGQVYRVSPKAESFPTIISPNHRNWDTGIFSDRFRVQLGTEPSTTITSHISKDGHYFVHPDPLQCRSLTVREAARLQTFPDDYLFMGNRTQQYVQVGNAVPPYLALQVANLIYGVLNTSDADAALPRAEMLTAD